MKKASTILIATLFFFSSNSIFLNQAIAQGMDLSALTEVKEPVRAAEFIYRSSAKESLIGVQLMGAVNKPGIYYVPPSTDILKLITLAGGAGDADLSDVIVKKTDPSAGGVFKVNVEKLIKAPSTVQQLRLAQDDFVYVPKREPWISNDVSRSITIVSLITSIILTGVLIERNSK